MFDMFQKRNIVFIKSDGGRLKLTHSVLKQFKKFRQTKLSDHESGGVLLGRFILDSKDIVIDQISTPQKNDVSSPVKFIKQKKEHQLIVDKAWKKSGGTCNFLGEWHTHPQKSPSPSSIDIKNWKKIIRKSKHEGDSLFFLIIGTISICAFEVSKKENNIIQLPWQKRK